MTAGRMSLDHPRVSLALPATLPNRSGRPIPLLGDCDPVKEWF
jgi:hypothetical protein